jgi:DNA-binding transcriptional LysR family regulator
MVGTLLMPVINRFLVAYPQITLDLDFTDKLVNVIEDGFDVVRTIYSWTRRHRCCLAMPGNHS